MYHAIAAVTMPAQPPACTHHMLAVRVRSVEVADREQDHVTSSVRKTPNTAVFTRMLPSSMYVLKIANENRNHAAAFERSFGL